MNQLTPRTVVQELDKYIIGQDEAKRAVAIALRNRIRRLKLDDEMREEVKPKNLLMIGPTGVGKTEIARRLATIAQAPFVKVEATKYTEVGYVGRDVESMVRDLVENSIRIVKAQQHELVKDQAQAKAIEKIAKALRPGQKVEKKAPANNGLGMFGDMFKMMQPAVDEEPEEIVSDEVASSRRQIRQQIRDGLLDKHEVTIKLEEKKLQLNSLNPAMEQMMDMQESLNALKPKKKIERTVTVKEAVELLTEEEADRLVNQEDIHQKALKLAQENGIIFIDEMDKIATKNQNAGEVSRQGVQRDILPIVEGSQVQTKYGIINTDHILFIGSGAFHLSKPSDLIPELQGRFPIRVNLNDLTKDDFVRILQEPKNAIIKQYQALLATEGVTITFDETAINKMAEYAVQLNETTDNIGARRLHTILETVLEELLFESAEMQMGEIQITEKYVTQRLDKIVENRDLSHYIL
ncbi:ATP-dependent protease ATPase subunit HslU [Aerococcaceae bacterium zg-ZJ1578]|uniref:ATP-dependent protease ATPase subunit HslU n=1 Tax=Aerococcaceae TaxID=186827 RepID=UPI0013B73F85|nr:MULTISPECIES: ATP-dependent protease ATPase subunit HslU [unclassified Facklamia]MBK0348575.1 ATP-dependent protease ATPase subunit HslU [Aerococcaceae bacterium zg-1578]MBS4461938.1 ATP-dependent protease ATPase subunit HslU [Aerococcaceae bacterium zg-B36]QQD66447.1 ATP-dependent protease ATPase subunit HslU [Aerococcaceae bacterium zg-252]NEW63532.1 ATP-dependent protease ATPase subunit HslU [Facklamia sp. 252]NEW67003.1 ATP-dependent protease ATPase subunit HslU [Facklamia sp. 253]